LFLPLAAVLFTGSANAQTFKDVPKSDALYDAVEYLKAQGMLSGFPDGTFRPDAKVTRSEAVKLIVASKGVTSQDLAVMRKSPYDDVPASSWFLPSVEWARLKLSVIDSPPKVKSFHPARTVTKAEFLKMLLLAHGMDPNSYGEIKLPLASDVTDTSAWYYPYVRLAFATSMTTIGKSGTIQPDRDLTRGDVALFLYRLLNYKQGKRTQDLLTEVENELLTVVAGLNDNNIRSAEHASARALLAARGALTVMPKEPLVTGALKITESYRALVRGYRALLDGRYDDAIQLSKDAWGIAKIASEATPSVRPLALTVQKNSEKLAADARKKK
jgi:hypothetical protein